MEDKIEDDYQTAKRPPKTISKFRYKLPEEAETSSFEQLKIVSKISTPQIFTTVAF